MKRVDIFAQKLEQVPDNFNSSDYSFTLLVLHLIELTDEFSFENDQANSWYTIKGIVEFLRNHSSQFNSITEELLIMWCKSNGIAVPIEESKQNKIEYYIDLNTVVRFLNTFFKDNDSPTEVKEARQLLSWERLASTYPSIKSYLQLTRKMSRTEYTYYCLLELEPVLSKTQGVKQLIWNFFDRNNISKIDYIVDEKYIGEPVYLREDYLLLFINHVVQGQTPISKRIQLANNVPIWKFKQVQRRAIEKSDGKSRRDRYYRSPRYEHKEEEIANTHPGLTLISEILKHFPLFIDGQETQLDEKSSERFRLLPHLLKHRVLSRVEIQAIFVLIEKLKVLESTHDTSSDEYQKVVAMDREEVVNLFKSSWADNKSDIEMYYERKNKKLGISTEGVDLEIAELLQTADIRKLQLYVVRHNLRLVSSNVRNIFVKSFAVDLAEKDSQNLLFFEEGIVALQRSVEKFDHTKNNQFSTYAVPKIWMKLVYYLQKKMRVRDRPFYEEVYHETSEEREEMLEEIERKALFDRLIKTVSESDLTETQKMILQLRFIEGLKRPKVARIIDVSREAVRQQENKILAILRRNMNSITDEE